MSRKSLFVIIFIVVVVEVSPHKWFTNDKKSSACVGAKNLVCTKHRLTCPQNKQIKINNAFYGFVKRKHGCATTRTTCSSKIGCDCEWLHGDCGLPFTRVDNAEVVRCSGQRSCNPSSPVSSDNSNCHFKPWKVRKYNLKNSYTEIDYECIQAQRNDTTRHIISGPQIVLKASKDYAYTYSVGRTSERREKRWSRQSWMTFYQTNQKQTTFNLHGYQTQAGVEYKVKGRIEFTIQPNTDIFILLTGLGKWYQSDITVSYKRLNTDAKSTPTHPRPTVKSTTPNRFRPSSTSIRPRPEFRTTTKTFEMKPKTTTQAFEMKPKSTTQAFEMKPKSTTQAFEMKPKTTTEAFEMNTKTTTEAFEMEEVTRNIEDEIIKEENNDRMRPEASVAELRGSQGGIIGGVVGGIVAVIIILLILGLIICKRRRQKTEKPVVVEKGVSNPGYEVSYINPKYHEAPPAYEEINPRYDNSRVLPGRTTDDYDYVHDVNNQQNDVKDAEFRQLASLDVKDVDYLYDHLSEADLQKS